MPPENLEQPVALFPVDLDRKRGLPAAIPPTELTGCIKLAPENRDRLRMISVRNPGMRSRIDFLTASAAMTRTERFFRLLRGAVTARWQVEKDYFLSYHKEEPAISGRLPAGGTEYTVKRVVRKNRFLFEIYTGEGKRKPDRVIKNEQKIHKLGYPDEVAALLRDLIKKLPRTRDTDVYKQTGDSIIQRISIFQERLWRRSYYGVIFSTYYKGASRDSRRFFEKGYLPIGNLLPDERRSPKYLVVDAGPNPEFLPRPPRGGNLSATRFIIVPGEINFQAHQSAIVPYESRLYPATGFLDANPRFARIARQAGIADELIKADNLFVAQRAALTVRALANAFRAVTGAYRTLRYAVAGNVLFSFFGGLQEGAIVAPLMDMLENRYHALGWITTAALYFYPAIESAIEIKSGIKFDEVRNAEKSRRIGRVYINEELRAVQLRVAFFYTAASAVLIFLYPAIFMTLFGGFPLVVPVLFALFFSNKLFKDWAEYYEVNNYFRILIRTVGRDPEHHRNLLKVKAFDEAVRTLLRMVGLLAGMLLMWANPGVALAIVGAGIAVGCGAKFIYPLFGAEYAVSVTVNRRPFPLDNHNVALIPEKVRIHTLRDPRFEARGQRFVSFDPVDFEIIIDSDAPDDEPVVRAFPRRRGTSAARRWKLTWKNRCTLAIRLHTDKSIELVRRQSGRQIRYSLSEIKQKPAESRGTP